MIESWDIRTTARSIDQQEFLTPDGAATLLRAMADFVETIERDGGVITIAMMIEEWNRYYGTVTYTKVAI